MYRLISMNIKNAREASGKKYGVWKSKQEMSLKKTKCVGLKKGGKHKVKYLYINLTQMTENLQ